MTIRENGKIIERVSRNDLKNTFSVKHHKPVYRPGYKQMWLNQMGNNKVLLYSMGISLFLVIIMAVGCDIRVKALQADLEALDSLRIEELIKTEAIIIRSNEIETELASCSAKLPKPKVSKGKVSFYSHDGCIGCSPNQTMANGQPFDENAMTFAHNQIPLNTWVEVKNLDNGKTATAKVTDRGGFNKYNRVADLSKGLYLALGAKTDVSTLQFTWY